MGETSLVEDEVIQLSAPLSPPDGDKISEKSVGVAEEDEFIIGDEENSFEEGEFSEEASEIYVPPSHETLNLRSEFYRFPILYDPGLIEAFVYRSDPPRIYPADGQELFKDSMRRDNLILIRRFYDGLKKEKIDLQFSRLDSRAILPMSLALAKNTTVTEINLRGNRLSTDGAFHLAELLVQNKVITSLNLSGCKLGSDGICKLSDALEFVHSLQILDLSRNELGDIGLECLVNGITYNSSVKYLNLSCNKLTSLSCPHLTDIFSINSSITTLDLSWNDIVQESGLRKMLFSIGKLNETLEHFIFQWNGLAGENTASYFRNFLSRHKCIQELDISHNRFRGEAVMDMFYKGINSSESLLTFDLSFNPLTIENVGRLVLGIAASSSLKHLKLVDLWILREHYDVAQEIHHGSLFIDIEGTRGIQKNVVSDLTIRELLLKRCHYLGLKPKKKTKQREFGYFLLKLEESGKLKPIKRSKFEELVEKEELLLEPGLFAELVKFFRGEKNRIDLVLMLEMYKRLFPDVQLPKKKKRMSDRVSVVEPIIKEAAEIVDSIVEELITKSVPEEIIITEVSKGTTNGEKEASNETKEEPAANSENGTNAVDAVDSNDAGSKRKSSAKSVDNAKHDNVKKSN